MSSRMKFLIGTPRGAGLPRPAYGPMRAGVERERSGLKGSGAPLLGQSEADGRLYEEHLRQIPAKVRGQR